MNSGTESNRIPSTNPYAETSAANWSDDVALIVQAFEKAWNEGRQPRIEEYQPPGKQWGASFLVKLIEIDLRYRLAAGQSARIEEYLREYDYLSQYHLQGLLIVEWQQRLRHHRTLDPQELCHRFPKWSSDIDGHPLLENEAPSGYEVQSVLGKGGMGLVTRAYEPTLRRNVALKTLLSRCSGSPEYRKRFEKEVEATAKLCHPNIVQLYAACHLRGCPFFAMEYVPGPTLAEEHSQRPLSEANAVWVMETLARAMEYAHKQGIVHRDLKPSNILLAPRLVGESAEERNGPWIPKIADFGLALFLETPGCQQLTNPGQCVGTPNYMPPEQVKGFSREAGVAVDVYSLGAIFYELLTGKPPFEGEHPVAIACQVLEDPPIPVRHRAPKTHPECERVCLRCLEKKPSQRYASALELAEELRAIRKANAFPNQESPRSGGVSVVRLAQETPAVSTPVTPPSTRGVRQGWFADLMEWGSRAEFVRETGYITLFISGVLAFAHFIFILIILLKEHTLNAQLQAHRVEAAGWVAGSIFVFFAPLMIAGWLTMQGRRLGMWVALLLTLLGLVFNVAALTGMPIRFLDLVLPEADSARIVFPSLLAILSAVGALSFSNALRLSSKRP